MILVEGHAYKSGAMQRGASVCRRVETLAAAASWHPGKESSRIGWRGGGGGPLTSECGVVNVAGMSARHWLDGFVAWPDDAARRYRARGYWRGVTLGQAFEVPVARHRERVAV